MLDEPHELDVADSCVLVGIDLGEDEFKGAGVHREVSPGGGVHNQINELTLCQSELVGILELLGLVSPDQHSNSHLEEGYELGVTFGLENSGFNK